jgi:predicted GNAT family N-acyltransferase
MKVLRINASDTYQIRNQILRPGQPIEACHFAEDENEQTFHLGAFIDSKLVSVASFYFERNEKFEEEYQYRLRGMATLAEHQGKGLSSALLKTAFPIIKQNFCQMLWCNARTSAQGFYQKVGFEKVGDEFDIKGIGPHVLMFKNIN